MNELSDLDMMLVDPDVVDPFEISAVPQTETAPVTFADEERQQEETAAAQAALDSMQETAGADKPQEEPKPEEDEEERKRAEYEAAEAARRAEWEAKQAARKAAAQAELDRIAAMSDEELLNASMKRVAADTERLTRRNMKECVSESIQTLCLSDADFARLVMRPQKTMVHCFHFINRKAREYLKQEMEDSDLKPENGVYGGDVPDDLVYQWAEEYFRDIDAAEDTVPEEKFIPKPYPGKCTTKKKAKKNAVSQKTKAKKASAKPQTTDKEQLSFEGQLSLGAFESQEAMAE